MILHLYSPYYITKQGEEKSTFNVKEEKPLPLRSPNFKNHLIGQL